MKKSEMNGFAKGRVNGFSGSGGVLHRVTIVFENRSYDIFDIEVDALVWDEWNIAHIKKHGVTKAEVEISISDDNVVFINTYLNRFIALGRANNRLISTVLEENSTKVYYVVTSRDMAKKERSIYRNAKKTNDKKKKQNTNV